MLFIERQAGGGGELQKPQLTACTCVLQQGHPQTVMMCSVCFLCQRAKIGQGTKAPEEKTTNTISKLDNNGNRDRMKLTDFNFLMVLGKGSFGKVQYGLGAAPTPEGQVTRQAHLLFIWGLHSSEGESRK